MTTNVLILCTHNSARSILAEAMLNHWAARLAKDVRAFSAGSTPSGRVNPEAIAVLERAGVDTSSLRSKHWDAFDGPDAPRMRIVITVCDAAAAEQCPYWPGSPVKVHWGYPDPSAAPAPEKRGAFELTRHALGDCMLQLVNLPFERLTDAELKGALAQIAAPQGRQDVA